MEAALDSPSIRSILTPGIGMRAFDFVITLYSFVYALAVAQILSTVGDMIRAGKRLRFSWINAGWMLNVMLAIVAWWLSLWDLRTEQR